MTNNSTVPLSEPTVESLGLQRIDSVEISTSQAAPLDSGLAQEYGGPSDSLEVQAIYKVVQRYKPGIEDLAAKLGRTPKYLLKVVSGAKGAKLNVQDALAISKITGDDEMLKVMASKFGRQVIKLPEPRHATDDPRIHYDEAVRNFGLYIFHSSKRTSEDDQKRIADLIASFGQYCQTALELIDVPIISKNQMTPFNMVFLTVYGSAGQANNIIFGQFLADLTAFHYILDSRVRPIG